jgi:hypothetical protein
LLNAFKSAAISPWMQDVVWRNLFNGPNFETGMAEQIIRQSSVKDVVV